MPIPEQYRKQFEQQRQMAEMRSQLDKQYKKEMSKVALNDMPSFAEWMAKRQQNPMAKGGKVEVRPTVKDEALMRKIPQMEEAARKVSEGKMTHAAYDKVVAKHKPVKPYEFIPQPASDEDAQRALMENKKPHWRGHEDWPAGRKVGLRLDIPAYETHGVWVNSIHDEEGKGEDKRKTSYGPVSSVKNATFDAGPSKAIKVATGEDNKSPFARIKGELHHMTEDEAIEHMKKYLNHPDYAQVGMDPRRHGFFYDRKTLQPVTHAKHVVQIGPLVLAHKPTYGERESYAKGGITHKATGGKVEPTQDEMRLALTKRHGLYSPLEKAALEMPRTKGTGAEFMTELSKRPGFKAEEVADRQIPVPEGKMNKAEFLEHLKKHSLPPLEEKIKSEKDRRDEDEVLDEVAQEMFGEPYSALYGRDRFQVIDAADRIISDEGPIYERYQLPDGQNYREMLLKLPQGRPDPKNYISPAQYDADMKAYNAKGKEDYQSSHWKEDPNVLAHMRLSDRFAPNGEKLLHLEELQSDWHQEGRKKGYRTKPALSSRQSDMMRDKIYERYNNKQITEEEKNQLMDQLIQRVEDSGKTPDAPFKKSWHEMALKHVLHHAAKHGYRGLLITPGQEQADRYDLSKHLDEVHFDPTTNHLAARDHQGKLVVAQQGVTADNLDDYVGKEGAQKILSASPDQNGVLSLKGADLKVGGEGMKGFYDKIVPTYLNKLGKPHGTQVQMRAHMVTGDPDDYGQASENLGLAHIPLQNLTEEQSKAIADKANKHLHYFPIPPQMSASILKEGLPQYMRGGVIHKAEGGNVQPSIAQMKMEMAQKNSNVDLHNIGVNEAPDMSPKHFFPPAKSDIRMPSPGGVATPSGMPIGGIDMSRMQGGQQLMPNPLPAPPQPPQGAQPPQGGQPPQPPQGQPPMAAQQGGGNILQMTPQGQMMQALGGQPPKAMADGGGVTVAGATGTGGFDLHIPITTGGGSSGGGSGGGISSLGGMMNQGGGNASSAPSAPPPPTGMYTNRQQFGSPMQNLSNGMGGSAPTNYPKPTSLGQLNAPAGGQNGQFNQPHTGGFNYATGRFNDVVDDPNVIDKREINPNFMYGAGPTQMPAGLAGMLGGMGGQNPMASQYPGLYGYGPGGAPKQTYEQYAAENNANIEYQRQQALNGGLSNSQYFAPTMSREQFEASQKNQTTSPTMMMAKGGSATSTEAMKAEMSSKKDTSQDKRVTINAEGSGGVKGIVVPRHTLEGNAKVGAVGLHEMNEARAKVYGDEHREPLTLNKMAQIHKKTLEDHFSKPIEEQHEAESSALKRLRDAKHLGATANTLDESEKLDTVRHEHDEQGRTHVGFASKGVAGHALYTSGKGKDTKFNVINTCAGQTEGCGGGKDAKGIVDTMKGTCFAPKAESQYAGAATRRAAHEQAKHDPAMTQDWILAHTGSLRNAARMADKNNQRLLFRPNVVDETDTTSRHAIRHLNEQRKAEGKPPIISNSYGKTNELHDPENGYYVTHSNVGPKVKKGQEISENVGRDKARVRNTILAADNKGDFKNEQGNLTPPKGSYMVTDVKRGSPMAKKMEQHITHAKYWTTGRPESELTHEEREEGPEGHFSGTGRKTSEDKAHYGHITHEGLRYDYQKQHILHPRLVQVGQNKDGTPHMIPTDSRFKDTEFLPKNRFKTKNGKEAGHILMTTPTESTSNIGHQTSFTHNVSDKHIEHAQKNNGEYEIDRPQDQAKAKGKEYTAPQAIKFYAEGGQVGGRHIGFSHDDFHAFPEQNVVAQRHLAMRRGDDEERMAYHSPKKHVAIHKNMDTMRLELTRKK